MDINKFICKPLSWGYNDPIFLSLCEDHAGYTIKNTTQPQNNSDKEFFLKKPGIDYIHPKFLSESEKIAWESMGISFVEEENFQYSSFNDLALQMYESLACVRNLQSSISSFALVFHPILSAPNNDVSFSDPDIPFDIFCSIPSIQEANRLERFTESVIHETLHLQLTCIEKHIPLFHEEYLSNHFYSPWKGEGRNERGLLHAIYVFSNIRKYWITMNNSSVKNSNFIERRIISITNELEKSEHIFTSKALTKEGSRLATLCFSDL
ncbi:aKG-HExxH-type peptide beta-hydroxylase [Pectobacterium parmentieri]|uniref:aKG-HExxH-type peptide beta-hydroxylase n=1 Tax=Pectobacterium parmentieri TaxID=1905730 RepID=UPI00051A47FC|nr:HEXXH motif-containing putative peptide modification protein [Pectobacterium parmentieri]AOR59335.1 hypothetical protein A8F97_10505 [Pectobacterium parmentieri]